MNFFWNQNYNEKTYFDVFRSCSFKKLFQTGLDDIFLLFYFLKKILLTDSSIFYLKAYLRVIIKLNPLTITLLNFFLEVLSAIFSRGNTLICKTETDEVHREILIAAVNRISHWVAPLFRSIHCLLMEVSNENRRWRELYLQNA